MTSNQRVHGATVSRWRIMQRVAAITATVLSLAACGGGSDDDPVPALATSSSSVSVSANVNTAAAPTATVNVTLSNAPAQFFFLADDFTRNGLASTAQTSTSTQATVTLTFKAPSTLAPATYSDTLLLRMCGDPACSLLLASAPVSVQYQVTAATGASAPQVTLSATTVTQSALATDQTGPVSAHAVDLTFANFNVPPQLSATAVSTTGIASVSSSGTGQTQGSVSIQFKVPNQLASGTYNDSVRINVCLDANCVNPVAGSPFTIPVTYLLSNSTTVGGANGYTLRVLPIRATDIVWDAVSARLYLSIPSDAPSNMNSIVTMDPATGAVVTSTPVGGTPSVIAVSGNGQYLYTGITGQNLVKRLSLPTLAPDLDIPLGVNAQLQATDIAVAPGQANSIVVALGRSASAFYDDATRRTNTFPSAGGLNSLQWSTTPGVVYISGSDLTFPDLTGIFEVAVDANGASGNRQIWGDHSEYQFRFDGGLIYPLGGEIVDPVLATVVGTLPLPPPVQGSGPSTMSLVLPSAAANKAFADLTLASGAREIRSFALPQRTPIASAALPGYLGGIRRFVQWSPNGLAFNTSEGYVVLISGSFVAP